MKSRTTRLWIAGVVTALLFVGGLVTGLTLWRLNAQGRRLESFASVSGPTIVTEANTPTAQPVPTRAIIAASPTSTSSAAGATASAPLTPTPIIEPTSIATSVAPTSAATSPAQTPTLQKPSSVEASETSSQSRDSQNRPITYVASNIDDGDITTAWRVDGDGTNKTLTLNYDKPIRVSEIRLLPGYAKIDPNGTSRFVQNRRVKRVRFEFSSGSPVEQEYLDQPELQPTLMNNVETTFVRIVILETLPAAGNDIRDYTPISEVEVLGTPAS